MHRNVTILLQLSNPFMETDIYQQFQIGMSLVRSGVGAGSYLLIVPFHSLLEQSCVPFARTNGFAHPVS